MLKATGSGPAGDISGRTKLNQYRQTGDILQLNYKTPIGTAKIGFWYEHSTSHRYGYDYDVTALAAANGVGHDFFDFAIANSGPYFNYKEKNTALTVQANGAQVPLYIKYDEYTQWNQYQGFGEFEFKLLNDNLTVTPGVKIQNFTRSIDTPIAESLDDLEHRGVPRAPWEAFCDRLNIGDLRERALVRS